MINLSRVTASSSQNQNRARTLCPSPPPRASQEHFIYSSKGQTKVGKCHESAEQPIRFRHPVFRCSNKSHRPFRIGIREYDIPYKHYYGSIRKAFPGSVQTALWLLPTSCIVHSIAQIGDSGSLVGSHGWVTCHWAHYCAPPSPLPLSDNGKEASSLASCSPR